MTIKVKEKTSGCSPVVLDCGDWFDLCLAEDLILRAPEAHKMHIRGKKEDATGVRTREVEFDYKIAKLGVCMEIPKGYEAIIVPRSSTFKKYGLMQTNSIGVIDNTYNGDNDEWGLPVVATRNITIPKHTRICQFRIQLSQKASVWQRLKWLFSPKIKIKCVTSLGNKARGGFGSTGN